MSEADVRKLIRTAIEQHGTMRAFARSVPIQTSVVCRTLQGGAPPGPRLCQALGIRRVVSYVKVS